MAANWGVRGSEGHNRLGRLVELGGKSGLSLDGDEEPRKGFEHGQDGANQCDRQRGTAQAGLCIVGALRRPWTSESWLLRGWHLLRGVRWYSRLRAQLEQRLEREAG